MLTRPLLSNKIFLNLIVVILVFLAVSSGLTKVLLMPQDVNFFGQYGFNSPLLVAYGGIQLFGGILLILPRTRVVGALIVAITFFISMVVLLIAGNIPVAIVTLVCIALLGLILKQSLTFKSARLQGK